MAPAPSELGDKLSIDEEAVSLLQTKIKKDYDVSEFDNQLRF